jgi:hypothetical protein
MASTTNNKPRITAPQIYIDIPNPSNKTQIQHTTLTLIKNNLRHAHNTQQQNINHECSASQLLTTKTCSFAPTNTTLVLGSTQQIRSQLMLNLLITTQQTKLLNLQQSNFEPTPTTTPPPPPPTNSC